ncbi:MAG: hypothetical protein WDZ35_09010 [Crocinitomicaceae bacterium]
MRANFLFSIGIVIMMIVSLTSCKKDGEQTDKYSFWKGDIENHYYILDMNNQKYHLVKGKPFMVLEYDPVSNVPIRCEFGLSEAKNEYLSGAEGAIPEPFMYASDLEYAKKLELSGSVSLLCSWGTEITSHEELSDGGSEFFVDKGSDMWGHEILHFNYTINGMEGEINNEEATWGGRVSDPKAFKLVKKFSSNKLK